MMSIRSATKLSNEDLKHLLIETLRVYTHSASYSSGNNPYLFSINGKACYIFIDNIVASSEHRENLDECKLQFSTNTWFEIAKFSRVGILFLGYYHDEDVFTAWNPNILRQRVNQRGNVSVYTRFSKLREASQTGIALDVDQHGHRIPSFRSDYLGLYIKNILTMHRSDEEILKKLVRDFEYIDKTDARKQTTAIDMEGALRNENKEVWRMYNLWNDAIAKTFFSDQSNGVLVYLDLDEDKWPTIARELDVSCENPRDDFIATVKRTIQFGRKGLLFNYHLEKLRDWENNPVGPPPCIALLAMFVVIAERMISDEKFSGSNYYGRLNEYLNIRDKKEQKQLQNSFRKQSLRFWDSLNQWLNSNDGRFGLPTAFSFDHRKYVGVPISQALIREGDRRHFVDCFQSFGLRSGQQVSYSDMERMLDNWLPSSGISTALKNIWKKSKDARQRISEVVCIELASWDGIEAASVEKSDSVRPLLLACRKSDVPRLNLQFEFVTPNRQHFSLGKYLVQNNESANEILVFGHKEVTFVDIGIHGFSHLQSKGKIHLSESLLTNIVTKHTRENVSVSRKVKPIIVLFFHDEAHLYIESRRVELSARHILLVHKSLTQEVRDSLDLICGDEYRELTHENLESIPSEFVVFLDVLVTGRINTDREDLQCLIPAASTNIEFDGGYSITGRDTWHSKHPPTVNIATFSSSSCVAHISNEQRDNDPIPCEFMRATSIDLRSLDLPDGNYRIDVTSQNEIGKTETLTTKGFHLRSAEYPRVFSEHPILRSPEFESISWVLSARKSEGDVPETSINGSLIKPWASLRELSNEVHRIPREISGGHIEETDQVQKFEPKRSLETQDPTCLGRGYHIWILPPGRGKLLGQCGDCGVERWHGYGTAKKKKAKKKGKVLIHMEAVTPALIDSARSSQHDAPDVGTIYDALVHRRQGTLHHIKQLIQPLGDESFRATNYLAVMSALGHLETCVDLQSGRLLEWQITPTVINYISPQCIYLSGLRTENLVEEIGSLVERIGGSVTKTVQSEAPPRLGMTNLSIEQVRKISELIPEALTRQVHVSSMPSQALAERLPSLESLLTKLPTKRWPDVEVQKFSFTDFRWHPIIYPDSPGAYRFSTIQSIYVVVTEESFRTETGYIADYKLAKHLAGTIWEQPLLGYDADTKSLFVPLGCELPTMYERCVVLDSGYEPRKDYSAGIVEYRYVSTEVASTIWSVMTNR